jgi:anaerobic selenocysteine-containing dehydrogenase
VSAKPAIAYSACPHDCPSTCALEVEVLSAERIGRIRGAKENSYTDGVICAKVARYAERVHHPDRLTHPLRRKPGGELERISWDAALDEVAEAFVTATQAHGAEAVWPYFYAGTMGQVQRDGINRLRHAMGYSGQHATVCSSLTRAGWNAGVGAVRGPDPREMAVADLIVVWGGNPASTQVNAMSHIQKARKGRGAKLLVIDPYRTRSAKVADIHLALQPGTDGALACAVMHVLFRDGHADWDYMKQYADCPERLHQHLAEKTPEWAAAITGLDVAEIERFAKLYGETQRAFIRVGYGFTRSRNGAANIHAVSCLPTVTGKWRHKGAGAFYSNFDIYKWDNTLVEGLDVRDPNVRMLDMSRIGRVLTGEASDIGDGPPVTAMIVQNTNPAAIAPESALVNRGLARDDLFVCVHEQFMTDTAKHADIVLPATTFLEHDDIYLGGGHQYITLGPKVIEPLAETRANHFVICELAKRLGAAHPGFEMTENELIDQALQASGWPGLDVLREKGWLECQPDFDEAHFITGFAHADGKFRFAPDWSAHGRDHEVMPALPDHFAVIDAADDEHPFRLIAAPAHNYLNSSFTETKTSIAKEARPVVKIHPADADRLGVEDGARVRLGNRLGAVIVHVERFDGMQQGVVVVESIWPNSAFEGGVGINTLLSADAGPPNGGAVIHDTAVWVRAA